MGQYSPSSTTRLLADWRRGDERALDALLPRVYEELRSLAARHLASERPDHTLQATALVHEAYARLVDADISWQDRIHFFAVASGTMRRVLVDHARARSAEKRGGGPRGSPSTRDCWLARRRRTGFWNSTRLWTAWPVSTRGRRRRWSSATSAA